MKKYGKVLLVLFSLVMLIINTSIASAKPRTTAKPPSSPTNLRTVSVASTEVNLTWGAVTATGYKIYKASPNDSNYTLLATTTSTSYKDTQVSAGTSYWYYVVAYNNYGNSLGSNHLNVVVPKVQVPATTKKVLGFTTYYYSGDSSSYNSMVNNSSTMDEIVTHNYITDGQGTITGLIPTNQLTYANSNGIEALAMVANNFDGNIAKTLLESSVNVQNLINNILVQIKTYGYKGVNIDLEGVYYYNRTQYTEFIKQLYNTLKPQGFKVTVSVPAKTTDSPTNTWSGAYDYAQLGSYADKIILMTYDEHYPGGTPGAIASINWVENVIKYAVSVIPKEKILLGTAAYGYDWSSNGTKAYGIQGIYNLASQYGATILWDNLSQTPYFTYTDASGISHTVWFENESSVKLKLDLVNKYDLNGIGIWRLGLENSAYWTSIKEKFLR